MKQAKRSMRPFLAILVIVTLIVSALPRGVSAASGISIVYGDSYPQHAASTGETVSIWADASQLPMYDFTENYYIFTGWETDPMAEADLLLLDDRYSEPTTFTMPAHDVTFYATFYVQKRPAEPVVTNIVEGNGTVSFSYQPNSDPSYPEPTHYYLYDFTSIDEYPAGPSGTFQLSNLQNYVNYTFWLTPMYFDIPGKPHEFTVMPMPAYYEINFDSNGGSNVDPLYITEGESPIMPADPTREGYRFLGWYDAYNTSLKFDPSLPVWSRVDLIAMWEKIAAPIATPTPTPAPDSKVTFDSDGGSAVPEQAVKKGEQVRLPGFPAKNGFTFLGWFDGERRYDFRQKVESDLTLKALWKPVTKPYDLETLIGQPGRLDGEIARAIGLSGIYDPAKFRVSLASPYPSIRLELIDTPGAAIVFSNPPTFRHEQLLNVIDEDIMRRHLMLPYQYASKNHFEPKFVPFDIREPAEGERDGIGEQELAYAVYGEGNVKRLANDYITTFEHSLGVIHLEYPETNAEITKGRLIHALSALKQKQGERPAITFAGLDAARGSVDTAQTITSYLEEAIAIADQGLVDLRLNAELAEHAGLAAKADAQHLANDRMTAGQTAGQYAIPKEDQAEIESSFGLLKPYGIETTLQFDDNGDIILLQTTFADDVLYERFRASFPVSYGLILDYFRTQRDDLTAVNWPPSSEVGQRQLLAATELLLRVDTDPSWRDPILHAYRDPVVYAFVSMFHTHATADSQLETNVYDAVAAFIDSAAAIEASLPPAYFASRCQPYVDSLVRLKAAIDARGKEPLPYEELNTMLQELDLCNELAPPEVTQP